MEVTVAQPQNVAVTTPAEVVDGAAPGFVQRVMALPAQRKVMLGGGIAALLAIFVAMALWGREGDYRVLYANLSDKDGGAILAQLQQMQVPYKHADGGAAILVPADKVHDVRLKLASAGLPKGSVVGFELMENQKFGTTQFQERLNFQRGLEGELTRSIQAISSVQSARVHLALPNQNGFFREQQKASASVVLTLYPGRTLDRGQLAGIVHLVSSSVPEMSPKAVSVVDQSGTLLAGQQDSGADQAGLDAQQLQYVRQIESSYTQRVRDILEPVLGADNLRAQVTADVDFSQVEQTAEEFKPNQGPNAATTVRSQQTSESSGQGSASPSGVPGAASNQPPAQATAPINGASAPLQAAGQTASSNSRRDAVTNYEVDRTVRVVRSSTGNIRRLTAAVVVNHRTVTDAKGKTTTEPLPQEELDKLTALVRESIGADDKRGDSIKVVSAPFQAPKEEVDDTPLWKKPETVDLIRTLAVPGALTLAALIVVFGAIRPAIQAAKPAAKSEAEANRLNAVVDDAEELSVIAGGNGPIVAGADGGVAALEGPGGPDLRLEHARKLAKENPLAMASMVRGWMNN